jgi:hypothetical protein
MHCESLEHPHMTAYLCRDDLAPYWLQVKIGAEKMIPFAVDVSTDLMTLLVNRPSIVGPLLRHGQKDLFHEKCDATIVTEQNLA